MSCMLPPLWDIYWPTVALAIFAALTAFLARRTLVAIEKQADAMMDADRSLVLIDWSDFIHNNPEAPNGVLSHAFNWDFRNVGKSPAFIDRLYSRFVVIKSLADLPAEPDYTVHSPRDVSYESEPLLPDKSFGPAYAPLESPLSFQEVESDKRSKKILLYAFGFVQYRDIYGREHETRFGLVYEPVPTPTRARDRFRLAGPPAYNRYIKNKHQS